MFADHVSKEWDVRSIPPPKADSARFAISSSCLRCMMKCTGVSPTHDRSRAVTLQQFGQDLLPLILLFAISVTGLLLTASDMWMKGYA